MFPRAIKEYGKTINILYRLLIVFLLTLWLIPLFAVFLTAMRSVEEVNKGEYWTIPDAAFKNLFDNFSHVLTIEPVSMLTYFNNSLVIVIPSVFFTLCLASTAGYALSKFNVKWNALWFTIFVGGNFVPFQILMIPVRQISVSLGLSGDMSIYALILFHMAFQTGFCTLFMRNFMVTIPDELIEAGRLDGMNEAQIFLFIALPLMRPALAALAVLIFTFIWNDYFWSIALISDDNLKPITAGIASLKGQWNAAWHYISAGAILAALPPVLMFFFLQKHFISGLTMGATKG